MKKLIVSMTLICFIFFLSLSVEAHPGNTDSNDKHSCWTNCAKWGLEYGEYHGHSSYTGEASSNSSTDTYIDSSPYIYPTEGEELYQEGYTRGLKAGEALDEYEPYDYELHRGNSPAAYERYLEGYKLGYRDGEKKRKQDKWAGETQAITDYKNHIKNKYTNESTIYQQAYNDKIARLYEIEEIGQSDGYTATEPNDTYKAYEAEVYTKFYNQALEKRQKELFEAGYNDAEQMLSYTDTIQTLSNPLQQSYKQGFDSNNTLQLVRQQGFTNGQSLNKLTLPVEHRDNAFLVQMYKQSFEEGRMTLYKWLIVASVSLSVVLLLSILMVKMRGRYFAKA